MVNMMSINYINLDRLSKDSSYYYTITVDNNVLKVCHSLRELDNFLIGWSDSSTLEIRRHEKQQ
jgi:hypothetical protein